MPPRHDHTMDALQYALGVPPLPSKDWDALNTFRGVPVNRRWPRRPGVVRAVVFLDAEGATVAKLSVPRLSCLRVPVPVPVEPLTWICPLVLS